MFLYLYGAVLLGLNILGALAYSQHHHGMVSEGAQVYGTLMVSGISVLWYIFIATTTFTLTPIFYTYSRTSDVVPYWLHVARTCTLVYLRSGGRECRVCKTAHSSLPLCVDVQSLLNLQYLSLSISLSMFISLSLSVSISISISISIYIYLYLYLYLHLYLYLQIYIYMYRFGTDWEILLLFQCLDLLLQINLESLFLCVVISLHTYFYHSMW